MATERKAPATRKPRAPRAAKAPTDDREAMNIIVSRTDHGRAFVVSNRFSIANVEVRGRELLALSPINHVGPANLLVPMAELDELIADLTELRDAPGPEDPNDA